MFVVMRNLKAGSRGFSLIEILVALALSSLLIIVVSKNYLSAKNIYHAQTEITYLNENIRFADFVLWQSITQAGFAGCLKKTDFGIAKAIYGYDGGSNLPGYLAGKVVKGTDVIVIAKASADVTILVSDISVGARSFKVMQNPATEGNKFLLIADCENGELLQAEDHRSNTIHAKSAMAHSYSARTAEVRRFEELTFFVSNTQWLDERKQRISSLYFSLNQGHKQELVPGVGGMQIYYVVNGKHLKAHEVSNANLWDAVSSVIIELKMQGRLALTKRFYIKLRG